MSMPTQIVELLQQKPNLNSIEIASALNAKISSVKVTLHNMVKKQRLAREKVLRAEKSKAGPQNLYAYRIVTLESNNADTQNG